MKISIIIATYNAGKVLQRCLDSIRSQKTDEVELLIIDGDSKDDTIAIVNKNSDIVDYCKSEKDLGIYDAWNKGIKASTGEWIQFLGADDKLRPNAIEIYQNYLESHDVKELDVISGKSYLINDSDEIVGSFGKSLAWKDMRHNMLISHGSTLHKREFVLKNGLFSLDYKICADYEFFVRYGNKIKADFIDEYLINFRVGGASDSIRAIRETFSIRQRYHSISCLMNLFYFAKGLLGYNLHKILK